MPHVETIVVRFSHHAMGVGVVRPCEMGVEILIFMSLALRAFFYNLVYVFGLTNVVGVYHF